MTFSSLKKNNIEYCGGTYSINEYRSIRVSIGYLRFLDPDEAKKFSLSDWNGLVSYMFPQGWIEYIRKTEEYPYIHLFEGKVSVPDDCWVVMRILRHNFGKPVRATMAWFQFNSKGDIAFIRHQEATQFCLKGYTLGKIYKRGKEPLVLKYHKERKVWW